MTSITLRFPHALQSGLLAAVFALSGALPASSQATGNAPIAASAQGSTAQSGVSGQASSPTATEARARRRVARRRARSPQQKTGRQIQPSATSVGPTAAQRQRDAQILATQKAQSAAEASENDALTQKVIADRQKQEAEPRIQDAPGPDSQPLPGNPAIAPVRSAEPSRVQDAPGPAQTLPQAPPPTATPPQ